MLARTMTSKRRSLSKLSRAGDEASRATRRSLLLDALTEPQRMWWMRGLAIFSSRPSFLAAGAATGSPLSDFCCVHLTRERHDARGCLVEWW